MINNKSQSKSTSKRKTSYAPIMLTSKSVKPLYRQDRSQLINNNDRSESSHVKKRFTRFVNLSQQKCINNEQFQNQNEKINALNLTQNNFNNLKRQQLAKTFSYTKNKSKFYKQKQSQQNVYNHDDIQDIQIPNQSKELELKIKKNKQKKRQSFPIKQAGNSTILNMEFHEYQYNNRKNNANNTRYHVLFSNQNIASRPTCKSVPHTTKNASQQGFKQQNQVIELLNQGNEMRQSAFLRKNINDSKNKQVENYFWLKDPTRKYMLSQKQKAIDMTFTNFKQKIYERKITRMSNYKTKHNEEWNDYLNKYYLNIKKVNPLLKFQTKNNNQLEEGKHQKNFENDQILNINNDSELIKQKSKRQSKSSVEIVLNQFRKSQAEQNNKKNVKLNSMKSDPNIQGNNEAKLRSNTIMASSKTTGILSSKNNFPSSPKKIQKTVDSQKIQQDIFTKRLTNHQKNHFVFSLGDVVGQSRNQNPNLIRFHLYKDFLWKVNFTNLIHVRMPDDIQKPYKFYVGKGNNSALIKGIMRRRYWWQIVDKISPEVNFLWTQLRVNQFVKSQKKRKHEQLKFILNQNQIKDLQKNLNYEFLPEQLKQTFQMNRKVFKTYDLYLWLQHFKNNSKNQQKHAQEVGFNILSKRVKSMVRKKNLSYWDSSQTIEQKTHNHFESNFYIGNKKALFYAMRKYYKLYDLDPFDFIPLTFHINGGLQDPEFNQFLEKYNKINEQRIQNKNMDIKNIWIVKPGQVTNRGRGITVCATLDEIKIRLKSKQKNSDGSLRTYILQKYIQKPFLYQKRKFDIRHYMLMTCINGCIKGYWYQQGYIRTTSTEYNIKNCKDLYTHLTNDAIQKNSADYGKFQKGNKISYEEFQKYLTKNYKKGFNFFEQILPKMKRLATDAMRATYSIIEPNRRQNNFELFGLDFMLDEQIKVYLIECNTNPCLQLSCPLLSKIISGLIENVFKICIDPIFPPPFEWGNSKKFQMGEDALRDMKFEIVFDQLYDGRQLQRLYNGEKKFEDKIGKVEEDDEQYQQDEDQKQWNDDDNP